MLVIAFAVIAVGTRATVGVVAVAVFAVVAGAVVTCRRPAVTTTVDCF